MKPFRKIAALALLLTAFILSAPAWAANDLVATTTTSRGSVIGWYTEVTITGTVDTTTASTVTAVIPYPTIGGSVSLLVTGDTTTNNATDTQTLTLFDSGFGFLGTDTATAFELAKIVGTSSATFRSSARGAIFEEALATEEAGASYVLPATTVGFRLLGSGAANDGAVSIKAIFLHPMRGK